MKHLYVFLLFACLFNQTAFSQDVIIKVDGDSIMCKIKKQDNLLVYYTFDKNGSKIDAYISMSQVKSIRLEGDEPKTATKFDKVSLGVGLGMDFGGYGLNLFVYPKKNIGLFGGVGYAFAGAGFNGGLKLRLLPDSSSTSVAPYFLAMYGYNAAIAVANADELNKIFLGPTFGAGIDFKLRSTSKNYWSIAILLPIRGSEVEDYIDHLKTFHGVEFKNELPLVGISIGYRIVLDM